MMSMTEQQWIFLQHLARLISYAALHPNIRLTGGDLWAQTGHMKKSLHYDRLAIDLNLHVKEVTGQRDVYKWRYVTGEHWLWDDLGTYWKSLSPQNRHGGDFDERDYNHFSRAVDNRA